MNYSSYCSCGETLVKLSLPKPLEKYAPRACDCDFCTKHSVSYLSAPDGFLEISNEEGLEQLIQGSEQAIFLQCKSCYDLIGVTHEFDTGLQGVVNAKLFAKNYKLQDPIPVSPKKLAPEEKRERWKEIWMRVCFKS